MNSFSLVINSRSYRFNIAEPLDVSIPLKFDGAQPNAYGVEKASSKPCEAGALVGDTRRGGSCNFEQIKLIPHCNGTHTESIGHLTHERISVADCLRETLVPATLVSILPENALESGENYSIELNDTDTFISRRALATALKNADENMLQGLIIRTLPNNDEKLHRTYLEIVPPFFSNEAMQFIVEKNVRHLLIDLPSIDRIFDEGKLSNHRRFWNVEPGSFEITEKSKINNTITELIYVPDHIADGNYLLNLQIPAFASDAAPSRPLLFKII